MSNKSDAGRQRFRYEAQLAASNGYAAAILTQELTRACTKTTWESCAVQTREALPPPRLSFISVWQTAG